MKVSLNWIKEHLDIKQSNNELMKLIISCIGEIEEHYALTYGTDLVIGEVLTCEKHPNSDHLHVCSVDLGDSVTQIVCGAGNVAAYQKVIVAKVGCKLKDLTIKEAKIRGVESFGMICSLSELGIDEKYQSEEDKKGICVLGSDAKVGGDPLAYLALDDYIIDLAVTPNRGDLLSIYGVAFELACAVGAKPHFKYPNVLEIKKNNPMKVLSKTDRCLTYHMRYIEGVRIEESPNWLKGKLIASGIRPINNIVDITNYILIKYGQPLHAFDGDLLGDNVVVREAYDKEEMVTLDGIKRSLLPSDILITDGVRGVCLGGVMGGLDTEVTDQTTNIALEAAVFDPTSIRLTSSRLNLKSEASQRFERKVDLNKIDIVLDEAAYLMATIAGGKVLSGISKYDKATVKPLILKTKLKDVNAALGTNIKACEFEKILDGMTFSYIQSGSEYEIRVPLHRVDYDSNIQNLYEDIARYYGLSNIPYVFPKITHLGGLSCYQQNIRRLKSYLTHLGLHETITYTLTDDTANSAFNIVEGPSYPLLYPITEERKETRLSIIPSLLEVIKYNTARNASTVNIFEVSNLYSQTNQGEYLAGAISGVYNASLWQKDIKKADFFLAKGILEGLFAAFGVEVVYEAKQVNNLHPKQSCSITHNGVEIGYLGALHPAYIAKHNLPEVFVFELNLAFLEQKIEIKEDMVVSKYPSVSRDLALVMPDGLKASDIISCIKQTAKKLLVELSVFDVYKLEAGTSIAIHLVFNDPTKTLETSEVNDLITRILKALQYRLGVNLRS